MSTTPRLRLVPLAVLLSVASVLFLLPQSLQAQGPPRLLENINLEPSFSIGDELSFVSQGLVNGDVLVTLRDEVLGHGLYALDPEDGETRSLLGFPVTELATTAKHAFLLQDESTSPDLTQLVWLTDGTRDGTRAVLRLTNFPDNIHLVDNTGALILGESQPLGGHRLYEISPEGAVSLLYETLNFISDSVLLEDGALVLLESGQDTFIARLDGGSSSTFRPAIQGVSFLHGMSDGVIVYSSLDGIRQLAKTDGTEEGTVVLANPRSGSVWLCRRRARG